MFVRLIDKRTVDKIIDDRNIKVSGETTPEEMLQIIKTIVFEAINSISEDAIYEAVTDKLERKLRASGIRF